VLNVAPNNARDICAAIERFAEEALPVLRRDLCNEQSATIQETTR
jgi:hypothetical protein